MASKGIVCLLAVLYLVKSSYQNANEDLSVEVIAEDNNAYTFNHTFERLSQGHTNPHSLARLAVSSLRSGQPENGEEENRAEAQASAHTQASLRSLMLPGPGYQNPWDTNQNGGVVRCRYEEQVINTIVNGECLVCVCVMRRNTMSVEPVCGSCNNCQQPPYLEPPRTQDSVTLQPPTSPTPPEVPKCDPLPPNVPFQNPLDPCQVCICLQSTDLYGNPQSPIIECQRNPECVPIPTPTPPPVDTVCSVYPINVWFKHPWKQCEICECTPEQQYGQVRPVLVCLRDPACDEPATTILPPTTPLYPTTTDWPITPSIPTSPSTPTTPPPPPPPRPPRKSCYPFIPNVPFNHTWDPCQICVCTEDYYDNTITIEIQCQTRRDCCLEWYHPLDPTVVAVPLIPGQVVQPGYPHVLGGSANAIAGAVASTGAGQASSSANAAASSVLSPGRNPNGANPNHNTVLYPDMEWYAPLDASPVPGWSPPGQVLQQGQGGSSASSSANAGASSVLSPGQNPNGAGLLYPSGSQSQSTANAGAVANVNNNPQIYPGQPGSLPTQNLFQTHSNAQANANTQTLFSLYGQGSQSQSTANAGASVDNLAFKYPAQGGLQLLPSQSNLNSLNAANNPQLQYQGYMPPFISQNVPDSSANNVVNGGMLQSFYGLGLQPQSEANAEANANSALSNLYGGSQAAAQADASANTGILNSALYQRQPGSQTLADASANAGVLNLPLYQGQLGSLSLGDAGANAGLLNFPVYQGQLGSQNLADASANAGVLSSSLYQGQLGSQSLADASANAASNLNSASYPYGPVLSQNTAEADASAIAGANSGLSPYTLLGPVYGSGPNLPQMNSLSQANAIAQANTQAQQNAMAQTNAQAQAQAILAQLQGDSMQKALVLPNPYSGGNRAQAQALAQGQSSANAQASSQALGGDSSQASAQAYAASKKSGEVEEGGL